MLLYNIIIMLLHVQNMYMYSVMFVVKLKLSIIPLEHTCRMHNECSLHGWMWLEINGYNSYFAYAESHV